MSDKKPRQQLPVVAVRLVRCPRCGSREVRFYKTIDCGYAVTRYTRCRACGQRFLTVAD